MQINCFEAPFPFMVIDDYFTQEEYDSIWEELKFLVHKQKLLYAEGSATNDDGSKLKNNYCRYLDTLYTDRSVSNILTVKT